MSDLPAGFERVREGRLRVLVRADVRPALMPLLLRWAADSLVGGRSLPGGRGGSTSFDLGSGLSVVLRSCRRGGFPARVNRRVYFGYPPRPERELCLIERLRTGGFPTVEPLASAVVWLFPGCYRGALVSREISLSVTLWQYLHEVEPAERERVCELAARLTRRLHDAGVVHPDLNLQNYLVRRGGGSREMLIIDFDRARAADVSPRLRRKAFARLCRSMRRLDPEARVLTLGCVEAFQDVRS